MLELLEVLEMLDLPMDHMDFKVLLGHKAYKVIRV
jgi:hypothetical protein